MATDALDTRPKHEVVAENKSLKSRMARFRDKTNESSEKALGAILSTAGGAAAGVLDSKYPSIKGTVISGGMVAGVGLTFAALAGWAGKGKTADQMAEVGTGMLAGAAAIKTFKAFEAKKK